MEPGNYLLMWRVAVIIDDKLDVIRIEAESPQKAENHAKNHHRATQAYAFMGEWEKEIR